VGSKVGFEVYLLVSYLHRPFIKISLSLTAKKIINCISY